LRAERIIRAAEAASTERQRRHRQDGIYEFGAKEMWRRILGEVDIVEHPAQIAAAHKLRRRIESLFGPHRLEKGRELSTPERRLLHTLASRDPPPSHIGVLSRVFGGSRLRGNLEMGFDDIRERCGAAHWRAAGAPRQ